jgi:hypothetical protein
MKIAIMQPYFIPYAGYFRLITGSDLFIVYDCVQFPRRSWVHRNQLFTTAKALEWLTLPLKKQALDTVISNLKFHEEGIRGWPVILKKFPAMHLIAEKYPAIFTALLAVQESPVSYMVNLLKEICRLFNFPVNFAYSSALNIPSHIKNQDRILAIVKHYQATHYLNASGGRELYEEAVFLDNNVQLQFLNSYQYEYHSILQSLADESLEQVKQKILAEN